MKSIPPKQAAYLLDIFRSVEFIQNYVAGHTNEQFLKDEKTQDAVLRRILVAEKRLRGRPLRLAPSFPISRSTKSQVCVIGLSTTMAMSISEIVWETVPTHLPLLLEELKAFVAEQGDI